MSETIFKIGDDVWDVLNGQGVVESSVSRKYPLKVKFSDTKVETYTAEGKLYEHDTYPALYLLSEVKQEEEEVPVVNLPDVTGTVEGQPGTIVIKEISGNLTINL